VGVDKCKGGGMIDILIHQLHTDTVYIFLGLLTSTIRWWTFRCVKQTHYTKTIPTNIVYTAPSLQTLSKV